MNCKSTQEALSVGQSLTPIQQSHYNSCVACQGFESTALSVTQQVPELEAEPPHHLRISIQQRMEAARPHSQFGRLVLRAALTTCAIAIVAAPVFVALKARASLAGSTGVVAMKYGKPFHVKMSGDYIDQGNIESISDEEWFDGSHLRQRFYRADGTVEFDEIRWPEGGYCWSYKMPDGVLKKETDFWANGDHPNQPPKPVLASDFSYFANASAPSDPPGAEGHKGSATTLSISGKEVRVTPYEFRLTRYGLHLAAGEKAPFDRWMREVTSDVTVYRKDVQGPIVRIQQDFYNPAGTKLTLTSDYDYDSISAADFDPATLRSYPTSVPAIPAPTPKAGHK